MAAGIPSVQAGSIVATIKPVRILGFHGMNNLPRAPSDLTDQTGKATPAVIVNADVADGFVLKKRAGSGKFLDLPGAHSLSDGLSVMLAAGGNILYRLDGPHLIALKALEGPPARITYLELFGIIYFSNRWTNGIYDLNLGKVRPWGLDLPPAPQVQITEGDLEPGQYALCFTTRRGDQLSGNGPLTRVSWEGTLQGLKILNLPEDALCWITHPNGGELFLAALDDDGVIRRRFPYIQPLPTLDEAAPPPFTHFAFGHGRIWGARENKVYYSAAFRYENFPHLYLPFNEEVVMVAPVTDGLYVNSRTSTWWLNRTSPDKMVAHRVGDGAVSGTLVYAQVRQKEIAGNVVSESLPAWMDARGIVIGTNIGHMMHITDHRLKMNSFTEGAAFYRDIDGRPQTVFSLFGAPTREMDRTLFDILRRGKLFS